MLRTLPLPERLLLVIDDSPTKRYGPKVEGAGVHHNPTPGPAGQPFLYGHVWVTISLSVRHPQWGPLALPLRAMLYVRQKTMATIPRERRWYRFATKLQLAARLVEWAAVILKRAGKTVWVVVDGGYTKQPFLQRVLKQGRVVVIGRLRKDAHLRDVPKPPKRAPAVGHASMASTRSAWPNAPGRLEAGKRSNAPFTARPRPRSTKPSWRRTVPQGE